MSWIPKKPKQTYTISGLLIPHKEAVWLWENCRTFAQYPYEIEGGERVLMEKEK